ncbi:MAG: type II toxin-antitoxin system RelE/ParE family toxin [Bacteroidetes bacterium]|nr:type II toxin-antitoxin system RelE/ParE family toxin [Bacteroidota bacterium]
MIKTYSVVTTHQADKDIKEARDWYDLQEPWLGDYFLDQLLEFRNRLSIFPMRFPRILGDVRRGKLSKFQDHIYFIIKETQIVIIAVVHGKRHPDFWKKPR